MVLSCDAIKYTCKNICYVPVYKLVFHFTSLYPTMAVFSSLGLWTTADDIQSLCRIYSQVACQEEEDALFFWRHYSGGQEITIYYFDQYHNTFLMNVLLKVVKQYVIVFGCVSPVHGLAHTLHSLGHFDNPARKVHQWCTEETWRRRGGTNAL